MNDGEKQLQDIFSNGVASLIDPNESFRKKVAAKIKGEYKKDIVIKFGVDPTRPDIHLGHAVVFWKLRALQELGCKVVFLVGDVTAQIGDPTGKNKVRPEISFKEVEKNMETFLEQVSKILRTDEEVFTWTRNSDWFLSPLDMAGATLDDKLAAFKKQNIQLTKLKKNELQAVTFSMFMATLRTVTYSQLIDRDMFQERLKNQGELYMHELMYPVMQGVDSAVIADIYGACDLEIGGTDQEFNMLMGRKIMQSHNQEPQAVMTIELLVGLDGKEKMSKSLNNYIAIIDTPNEMVGKVMSIPDALIYHYAELCTERTKSELNTLRSDLVNTNINPRDLKLALAGDIVRRYYNDEVAKQATEAFLNTFSNKNIPTELTKVSAAGKTLGDALVKAGIIKSKTALLRLIKDGAVTDLESGEKISRIDAVVTTSTKLKIGKKIFVEIVPE